MNEKIEKIFNLNKITFLFMTALYYMVSIIRWNIIFKISGYSKYVLDINKYHTFVVDILFIITIFFSISVLSIYYFPYNEMVKATKNITVITKSMAFVMTNILFNQYSEKEWIVLAIDWSLCLFFLLDIWSSIRSYLKVMSKSNDYSGYLNTNITEQDYSEYQSKWYAILKGVIISSAFCGIVGSNGINISSNIFVPFFGLCVTYNWCKFYSLYKEKLYNKKIYFIISIFLLILVTVFFVINTYYKKMFVLNGLESFALYFSPLIVLYCSLNELNYEIVKYKYIYRPEETVLKIFL